MTELRKKSKTWVFTLNQVPSSVTETHDRDLPLVYPAGEDVPEVFFPSSLFAACTLVCGSLERGEETRRLHFQGYLETYEKLQGSALKKVCLLTVTLYFFHLLST